MHGETFEKVLERRIERRQFLKGAIGTILVSPIVGVSAPSDHLKFQSISPSTVDAVLIPPGYSSQVLARWGDPILTGAPAFNLNVQSSETQSQQFGFNCDFLAYFPLFHPLNSKAGLLGVNHEFTDGPLMFPTYNSTNPTRNEVDVELAAHGVSVLKIEQVPFGGWIYNRSSRYNRRITGETEIQLTGPAAGHSCLHVSYDPTGTVVRGTLNNCAGGKTPWGTMLTGEENFNQYFANRSSLPDSDSRKGVHARYGIATGNSQRRWELYHDRFDVAAEPNEAFRFGWVVEIDPYDPSALPKKRTALGRLKHEGATTVLARDGRAVVYSGDDERFEYMYKFVTSGRYNPAHRAANMDLLDSGTLYAARFNDDGTGEWIPLVGGEGPLAAWSHAQVLVYTRGAADLVGVTKMDRPEDIETNPVNGKVYIVLTSNTNRGTAGNPGPDAANPRANNRHGHIIELTEAGEDPASMTFHWDIFLLCGDPSNPAATSGLPPTVSPARFRRTMVSSLCPWRELTAGSCANS
jgi:uncharacterized protein